MHQIRFPLGLWGPSGSLQCSPNLLAVFKGPTSNGLAPKGPHTYAGKRWKRPVEKERERKWDYREEKGREVRGRTGERGGNGREKRASHTATALGLAKPRAGSG